MALNKDYSLLEYDVTQVERFTPVFWRKLLSPSLGYKS